ncbi:MAG: D-aminoacylase, partial [Moraxellaceae bacterium]
MSFDFLIRNLRIFDGSGAPEYAADLAVKDGLIAAIGDLILEKAAHQIDGKGLALAPGFIDVHTHDDTNVIRQPDMLPKISQGVTTVIVGNCGISASPVTLKGDPPDPMNLLGVREDFDYPTFKSYRDAVDAAQPSVNVAALVGHTALRNNHMDRLDRVATAVEITAMQDQLEEALTNGALGLSTGLAYSSAICSDAQEVKTLAQVLSQFGGVYTTHLRTEFDGILDAMNEA